MVERGGNKSHEAKQVYVLDAITIVIMEIALEHVLLLSPLVHVPMIGAHSVALPPDPTGVCVFRVAPRTFVKLHQDLPPPRTTRTTLGEKS